MMISKYAADGGLSKRGALVDARASLALLEGRLDETKRRAALAKLEDIPEPASGAGDDGPPAAARAPFAPAAGAPIEAETLSWRMQRDQADARLKQLDLLERQGALVSAADVRLAIEDAVTSFWTESERRIRQEADEIAVALKLNTAQAVALRDAMRARERRLTADFAEAMRRMAGDAAPRAANAA